LNFSTLSGNSRFVAYLVPAILIGTLINIQFHNASDKAPSGVIIETEIQNNSFPSNWYKPPVRVHARSLEPSDRRASIAQVKATLEKYPQHLISKNLHKVYLLSELETYGNLTAAVNSTRNVYICRPNWEHGACRMLDEHFHSCFSRILKNNYKQNFDEKKWTSINPADFTYGEGKNKELKTGDADIKTADPKNGFVCHYAKYSALTDFSMVSAYLFNGNAKLWDLASRYPRIEQKIERAIEFYESLDAKLNREYFKQLARKAKPCC
jgi:hypothetical protein